MSTSTFCSLLWGTALVVVCGCGGDPTSRLVAQLGAADPATRADAARALVDNRVTDDRVVVALTKCVADGDPRVRYFAIEALGKRGAAAQPSVPALKAALADTEKQIRMRAAFALHQIDPSDHSFEPVLVSAMREGDGKALLEIGAMGPDAAWAVPTLIELLSHTTVQVRVLAANDLGHIGPAASSATSALQRALGDSNAAVKSAAQRALTQIQQQPAK